MFLSLKWLKTGYQPSKWMWNVNSQVNQTDNKIQYRAIKLASDQTIQDVYKKRAATSPEEFWVKRHQRTIFK